MNLNNYEQFSKIDRQNMLGEIVMLPDQLEKAWELGVDFPLPEWTGIRQVLVAGMGGSAIGADLLAAYTAANCTVPVIVHRDYDLPAWAAGTDTLVILSSHSGNTEETLSAFQAAPERNCRILAVTTGGKIAQGAQQGGLPLWQFEHSGQPRAAVGYSFTLLLAALFRLKLIPDPSTDLLEAAAAMREQQLAIAPDVPIVDNPAKRYAGQLVDRWSVVLGSGILAPVARRWKGQISEVAKAWAQFEYLPEANHNTLAGIENPEEIFPRTMVFFLSSSFDHPRNQLRNELTRKIFMLEGLGTDVIAAQGGTPLSQMWNCLHYGDYLAFYLAMSYEVDPTPVNAIEGFKEEMKSAAG